MTSPTEIEPWRKLAKCSGDDEMAEAFFHPDEAVRQAATGFCHDCPVKLDCLAEALDSSYTKRLPVAGVWGGMTERQRTSYKRKNRVPFGYKTWTEYARAVRSERNSCTA